MFAIILFNVILAPFPFQYHQCNQEEILPAGPFEQHAKHTGLSDQHSQHYSATASPE
jgi:hypothetical protein